MKTKLQLYSVVIFGVLTLSLASCATPATPGAGATLAPTVVPLTSRPTAVARPTEAYPKPAIASPAPLAPITTTTPSSSATQTFPPPPTPILLQPQSTRAEQGKAYAFSLYTHCGVDFATDFDGSFWDLAGPRPTTIGNPIQQGTMTLVDANRARFTYDKVAIEFTRHVGPKLIPYLCL